MIQQVSDYVWRGPRPTAGDITAMDPRPQIVLDLEPTYEILPGVVEVREPMSTICPPKVSALDRCMAVLDPAHKLRTLVHCKQGVDRTGIVIACWRVVYQRYTPEQAEIEMMNRGFHSGWYFYWLPFIRKMLTDRAEAK